MKQGVEIVSEDGLIRVLYRGLVKYDVTTDMLSNVAHIGAKTQDKLLLIDIREADYQHYYTESIRHANEGPALGIDQKSFRIAFLGSDDTEMLRYIENVCVNRGFMVKTFTDESEAISWLRSTL